MISPTRLQFNALTAAELYQDIQKVVDFWQAKCHRFLRMANDEFLGVVNPALAYDDEPNQQQVRCLSLCFTEWLLFERSVSTAGTLLNQYINLKPPLATIQAIKRLGKVRDTQFFARFNVLERDAEQGLVLLRDDHTELEYLVYDTSLARFHPWSESVIAERIAKVNNAWIYIGKTRFVDRASRSAKTPRTVNATLAFTAWQYGESSTSCQTDMSTSKGDLAPGSLEGMPVWKDMTIKPTFYLRMLRDVLGMDGRFSREARFRYGNGKALDAWPGARCAQYLGQV